ncbi:hypothetical protein FIA58_009195 [Flavobacterium jejuense]|uniref:DUF5655 domain-containing protein n=1 Tax=Flavobacterium jejuense TaxID=1544455 RepID=A0ABX0IQL5_9FLAO|nr:hypothetical protein [Flavobacterium jejuense]NHN25848.1 hypothetical protein [Flavobacterium jejuense]
MRKTKSTDLSHFIRKISPYFKTSRIGNTLSVRFKYSQNSVFLILHENENSVFKTSKIFTEVKTSKNPCIDLLIHAQNFQELLQKLTYRYDLFFNENN